MSKMSRRKRLDSGGVLKLLASRQVDDRGNRRVHSNLHVSESAINRLGLEKELEGHSGCVNCLEWNEKGTILASASDDLHFSLWDPFRYRRLLNFDSGHRGNIFSVKFLPQSQDRTVITGAADCRIKVHDVEEMKTTRTCNCHINRIKRIATAPNVPYMFWTAAEDGLIMEVDLRTSHSCSEATNNVLVNLCQHMGGKDAEAKCLAINPCRPEQLAVGANDPFVRLFDRRMIRSYPIEFGEEGRSSNMSLLRHRLQSHEEANLADGCGQYFVAGHLATPKRLEPSRRRPRNLSTTYLTFSPSGTHLLANIGSEQIYLFDINNKVDIKQFDPRRFDPSACASSEGSENGRRAAGSSSSRDPDGSRLISEDSYLLAVERLIHLANSYMDMRCYTSAIQEYNKAIRLSPSWPQLYSKRAAAYMKRKWDGDMYAALRDCQLTLKLDPSHHMAHFWLAKCLYELSFVEQALLCLENFKTKFPEDAFSHGYKKLMTSLQNSLKAAQAKAEEDDRPSEFHVVIDDIMRSNYKPSKLEQMWRSTAGDYEARYCGHCNTTTDIKEANFFGSDGQFIVAGSDDGSFFVWDAVTTNLMRVLRGDNSIVNCLQPHPSACLLATSGIDPTVRLWSPKPEDGRPNERLVTNVNDAATANQLRMNTDPFEVMLMNMGYRVGADVNAEDAAGPDEMPNWAPSVNCGAS